MPDLNELLPHYLIKKHLTALQISINPNLATNVKNRLWRYKRDGLTTEYLCLKVAYMIYQLETEEG